MKKSLKLLFIAAAVLISAAASAQEKKMHFGVKAGANFSTLDYTDYKNNIDYQAGIVLQFNLPAWFSVEPDIMFHRTRVQDDENGRKQGLGYIDVPVNIQWGPRFLNDNMRVFLQASPHIGYAINKDIKTGGEEPKVFDWKNVNRFQYGAGVGLGVKIFAFQLSAEYTWNFGSIANINAETDFPKMFNKGNFSGFQVNLAIVF